MPMPGRMLESGGGYRFGFNGHEKIDEISGSGNYLSFGDFGYNPRTGRRYRLDPVDQIDLSNYAVFANNPLMYDDSDGERIGLSAAFNFGLNVGLGSKGLNYNVTGSAGLELKTPNFQSVVFASASVYGGQQLGTSPSTIGAQYDLTFGAYATVGKGTGSLHNFYTLNYNTPSPFKNSFDISGTYGQMLTYNSAINACGDGPGVQSQGLIGMRLGDNFSLSSNNDAKTYGANLLFKEPSDAGWTGGIVLNIGGVESGYQNFSGYWPEFSDPKNTFGYTFTAENRMKTGQNGSYHESLNKAFNFVKKDNVTAGIYSEAWFQNVIHEHFSNNGTYNYNNQGDTNVSGSSGSSESTTLEP